MDKHFPISHFDAVYVVDLCRPLLDVAQKRFAARGWTNVTCLCQDATTFTLPEWSDGVKPKGSLGFVTLSYSLSMVSLVARGFRSQRDFLILWERVVADIIIIITDSLVGPYGTVLEVEI